MARTDEETAFRIAYTADAITRIYLGGLRDRGLDAAAMKPEIDKFIAALPSMAGKLTAGIDTENLSETISPYPEAGIDAALFDRARGMIGMVLMRLEIENGQG